MSQPVIGFAGMSHLGLVSAVAAAERGFSVVGFDRDPARIDSLKHGELPIVEPDLPELLTKNEGRLSFTSRTGDLAGCEIVYVAADVPTDDAGLSDLQPIRALIDMVEGALEAQALLVVLSQVPPGFTRGLRRPAAQRFYQMETLIVGQAVQRALYPERFILGCADPRARLPRPLADFLGAFGCPILPMRYESAELAKISVNMCLVASISVANTLAELCERIGADWAEIVPALKLDKRIGQHAYLIPGLGIAGGNLERDLATVSGLAQAHGTDAGVVGAWTANSRHRREWALRTLHEQVFAVQPDAGIGILGLAYKENTDSTKNSPSLGLIAHLGPRRLQVFDPVVPPHAVARPNLTGAPSALEAARGMGALAIMTPWPEFRKLVPKDLAKLLKGRVVLDPHRVLDGSAVTAAGLDYFTLGAPPRRATRKTPEL